MHLIYSDEIKNKIDEAIDWEQLKSDVNAYIQNIPYGVIADFSRIDDVVKDEKDKITIMKMYHALKLHPDSELGILFAQLGVQMQIMRAIPAEGAAVVNAIGEATQFNLGLLIAANESLKGGLDDMIKNNLNEFELKTNGLIIAEETKLKALLTDIEKQQAIISANIERSISEKIIPSVMEKISNLITETHKTEIVKTELRITELNNKVEKYTAICSNNKTKFAKVLSMGIFAGVIVGGLLVKFF